jgi:hypothetical protein
MKERTIEEYKEIEGVRWVENLVVPTGPSSGILLGGHITTAIIRAPGAQTEYSVWGIHIATEDQLTFIEKADDLPIIVKFVDCRIGSPTLHHNLEIQCKPDSSMRLVIPPGVAHLPMNCNGLLTVNSPRIFWDFKKRLVYPNLDVINVERDRPLDSFPQYEVCRFPVPDILYPVALNAFRWRYTPGYEAPFVFDQNGKIYVLRRKYDALPRGELMGADRSDQAA